MGFFVYRKEHGMKKPRGELTNMISLVDGVYVNTKYYDGMHLHYKFKGMEGKPRYWGVAEYLGQYYNLDDAYDVQRCFVALIYTGVIRKAGPYYQIIHPQLLQQHSYFQGHTHMQDIVLIANLHGRILRVLNDHELDDYNQLV
jgi:hypothetical protein